MHLLVALDGPVAFPPHPSPINQPKPGSQEQLQVLPSHHLRARDVPSSSQGRNWKEKSFTFPSESSEKEAWILGFWEKRAKNILKLNVERNGWRRGNNWMKAGFPLGIDWNIVSVLHQMKTSDQRHPHVGFGAVCGFSCVFMVFFSKPVSFQPLVY